MSRLYCTGAAWGNRAHLGAVLVLRAKIDNVSTTRPQKPGGKRRSMKIPTRAPRSSAADLERGRTPSPLGLPILELYKCLFSSQIVGLEQSDSPPGEIGHQTHGASRHGAAVVEPGTSEGDFRTRTSGGGKGPCYQQGSQRGYQLSGDFSMGSKGDN